MTERVLLRKHVETEKLISISPEEAKALEDPVRALILDLLSARPMSVEELWRELKSRGYDKSINTVRHHLNILLSSGLVELVKVVERRGAHLKYYSSKAKLVAAEGALDYERLKGPISLAEERLRSLVRELEEKYGNVIVEEAKKLKPCPYCQLSHFKEYVLLEIIEKALARVITLKH